ncbi:MAG: hypothetical protein ACU0DI_15090, partial [Paracoccaceae bacterium]
SHIFAQGPETRISQTEHLSGAMWSRLRRATGYWLPPSAKRYHFACAAKNFSEIGTTGAFSTLTKGNRFSN